MLFLCCHSFNMSPVPVFLDDYQVTEQDKQNNNKYLNQCCSSVPLFFYKKEKKNIFIKNFLYTRTPEQQNNKTTGAETMESFIILTTAEAVAVMVCSWVAIEWVYWYSETN